MVVCRGQRYIVYKVDGEFSATNKFSKTIETLTVSLQATPSAMAVFAAIP